MAVQRHRGHKAGGTPAIRTAGVPPALCFDLPKAEEMGLFLSACGHAAAFLRRGRAAAGVRKRRFRTESGGMAAAVNRGSCGAGGGDCRAALAMTDLASSAIMEVAALPLGLCRDGFPAMPLTAHPHHLCNTSLCHHRIRATAPHASGAGEYYKIPSGVSSRNRRPSGPGRPPRLGDSLG